MFWQTLLNDATVQQGILAVVVAVIAWVGAKARSFINTNLTDKQRQSLLEIAAKAVLVAEQTGAGKVGEEKKAEAIKVAQAFLTSAGLKVDLATLDAAIEAAVYEQLNQYKPPVPVVVTEAAVGPAAG